MIQTLLDADTLLSRRDDYVVVDCRFELRDPEAGRRAYAAGHVPGSRFVDLERELSAPVTPGVTGRHPWPTVADATTTIRRLGISNDSQVVALDARSGAFAARLWWLLRWLGHDRVAVLDGGLEAWLAAGGTLSTMVDPIEETTFTAAPRPELLVDADRVGSGTLLLLDAREAPRFRGEQEPIDPVAGRIPGSVNYPFMDNTRDGRFLSSAELTQRFAPLAQDGRPLAAYCGSGVTACHLLLALAHANQTTAALYPGSWSEWITDPTRAIARG